jgi:hypothetical protein
MCLKCKEKVTNPLTQVNWIDDDLGFLLNCLCLLPISRGKFVMFLNLSFFSKEDMKKESLTTCYV